MQGQAMSEEQQEAYPAFLFQTLWVCLQELIQIIIMQYSCHENPRSVSRPPSRTLLSCQQKILAPEYRVPCNIKASKCVHLCPEAVHVEAMGLMLKRSSHTLPKSPQCNRIAEIFHLIVMLLNKRKSCLSGAYYNLIVTLPAVIPVAVLLFS